MKVNDHAGMTNEYEDPLPSCQTTQASHFCNPGGEQP